RLYEQMPDLYEAYDLRHRGEARKRPLLLEVHLRAGTPVEDIARLTGCRLPVVRTYGHLFMAVPDPPPGASAVSWANACAWGLGGEAFLAAVAGLGRSVAAGSRSEHFSGALSSRTPGGRPEPGTRPRPRRARKPRLFRPRPSPRLPLALAGRPATATRRGVP